MKNVGDVAAISEKVLWRNSSKAANCRAAGENWGEYMLLTEEGAAAGGVNGWGRRACTKAGWTKDK